MLTHLGPCPQCGATGPVGSICEYCGATISLQESRRDENQSVIHSWRAFHLDGFSLVPDNVQGDCDILDFCVIRGKKSGKEGLIDRNGIFVIPCIYDHITAYIESGVCCVFKDRQSGMFNLQGEVLIPLHGNGVSDMLFVQYDVVVGYNSIYDLTGNLLINIDSSERIILLSERYATTYPSQRSLYDTKNGQQLLSSEYKIDNVFQNGLFQISHVTNGFTRYGIFNPENSQFILPLDYTKIQRMPNGRYTAKMQISQDVGQIIEKTLLFSFKDKDIVIEKESIQTFQKGSNSGCLLVFAFAILFISSILLIS